MLVILFLAILFVDAFAVIKLPRSEKVDIVSHDMTIEAMLHDAVTLMEKAIDNNVSDYSLLCNHLVDDMTERYHAADTGEWQCIAGEIFGHFSTSEPNTFIWMHTKNLVQKFDVILYKAGLQKTKVKNDEVPPKKNGNGKLRKSGKGV